MNTSSVLLSGKAFDIVIQRLCHQLVEDDPHLDNVVLIGLQPRGTYLASYIHSHVTKLTNGKVLLGAIDPTFYRDDFRQAKGPLLPSKVQMDFSVEGKKVILIDDVLFTGRTIRAGMDAILDFGRPSQIELLVLVDRLYSRQLPIAPDYIGISVDTRFSQKVKVKWEEADGVNEVILLHLD